MRIRNAIIAAFGATAGLGGCTSDPAFWDAVAQGLDQAAYDLANEPVCTWYTDRFGVLQQSCVPAYTLNAPTYVATSTYYEPAPRYRDRDGDHDRDRDGRDGDRRDRRDGKPNGDRDRNGRGDHDGRRGPKG